MTDQAPAIVDPLLEPYGPLVLQLKTRRDLFRVVGSGEVKIQIGRKWPLAQAADTHVALEKRETTGSLILLP